MTEVKNPSNLVFVTVYICKTSKSPFLCNITQCEPNFLSGLPFIRLFPIILEGSEAKIWMVSILVSLWSPFSLNSVWFHESKKIGSLFRNMIVVPVVCVFSFVLVGCLCCVLLLKSCNAQQLLLLLLFVLKSRFLLG